jgi:hypothetical protein
MFLTVLEAFLNALKRSTKFYGYERFWGAFCWSSKMFLSRDGHVNVQKWTDLCFCDFLRYLEECNF